MTATRADFASVDGAAPPEGAEAVWYDGPLGEGLRVCVAPAGGGETRGSVLICPGRTEFIEKYFEVAREIQARGFAVAIFDWPGQGLSRRLLADPVKGHVDRFDRFTDAFRDGLAAVDGRLPRPHVILAHSMGGAIALAALLRGDVTAEAAAFSAPMWGIRGDGLLLRLAVGLARLVGRGGAYARPPGAPETFEGNVVTHDEARWRVQHGLVAADARLALGPPTFGWIGEAFKAIDRFKRRDALARLACPVFVASAEEEKLVSNAAHRRVAAALPDAEHVEISGARHEILMETEARRAQFFDGFDRLLARAKL